MAKISARGAKELFRISAAPRESTLDGGASFEYEFLLRSDMVLLNRSRVVRPAGEPKYPWGGWKKTGSVPQSARDKFANGESNLVSFITQYVEKRLYLVVKEVKIK